ncbi:ly6/PLAUR domain-containing protein 5 isoform X1 [Alligator mississippiensis]|uniref:ly6/PLAUR domain-containing protein 5 isoform X1 n=1 Tax=Alligator mississippiensis TaxID=8496 RepID=UPI0028778F97|nr:ly6/PLAUR domain-containing protein 5 isoform X1 [Alligator mississippiensis]
MSPRRALMGALLCVLLQATTGLECYSFEGTLYGQAELRDVGSVPCQPEETVCIQGTVALQVAGGQPAWLVRLGCTTGSGLWIQGSQVQGALRIFTDVQFCRSQLCNQRYLNRSLSISADPPANVSETLQCYSCIGPASESCSLGRAEVTMCGLYDTHCSSGTVTAAIGSCSQSFSISSCQALSCGDRLELSDNHVTTTVTVDSCCGHSLCNHARTEHPMGNPQDPNPSTRTETPMDNSQAQSTNAAILPVPTLPPGALLALLGILDL